MLGILPILVRNDTIMLSSVRDPTWKPCKFKGILLHLYLTKPAKNEGRDFFGLAELYNG